MGRHVSVTFLATLVPLTVVTLDILRRIIRYHIERKKYPLPPGPTPLPLVGNVLSIDPHLPWVTYTEWKEKYGDIIYVRILDTDVIVLNSVSIATDLLEKRSRIYSDRPFISTVVPYGNDCNFFNAQYGEHWRLCRRIFQQTFRANAAIIFRPMQLCRARQLICNMINDPIMYSSHFQTFSTAVAMSAVYDYEPSPQKDPLVSNISNFIEASFRGLKPGKVLLIKFFPFLLNTPEWLPWSWIRREAKEARAWKCKVVNAPYDHVRKRMASKDNVNTTMVSDHITRMEKLSGLYRSEYEIALKYASTTAILGSAETTSATLMTFTLAMVENPHVWKCAQMSIDAIVGTDRLPEFGDRLSLPYIEAIVRETLRWRPVGPRAYEMQGGPSKVTKDPKVFPHATVSSDIYEGYHIPKGAAIFVNVWAMTRNEARYPNANKFNPERFLDKEGKLIDDDPQEFIFGFGRRKCPGRYAADASIWSAIVTMLATLDFNTAKDADGNDITFQPTFTSGVIVHPNDFPCRLTPRAHISKEMIERVPAI